MNIAARRALEGEVAALAAIPLGRATWGNVAALGCALRDLSAETGESRAAARARLSPPAPLPAFVIEGEALGRAA